MFSVSLSFRAFRLIRRQGILASTLVAMVMSLAGQAPARAQDNHLAIPASSMGETQRVKVGLNKSAIIDLPVEAREVIVSQPDVASAIMRTKSRAIVQGLSSGETNMFFLDEGGRTIALLEVSVYQPPSTVGSALEVTLARVLPGSAITVESVVLEDAQGNQTNRVVLSGTAPSSDDVNKAISIAGQFAGAAENVASVISVGGGQQVMLKVTVAEVNRETVKQLGLDLEASFNTGGLVTGLVNQPALGGASGASPGGGVGLGLNIGNLDVSAVLQGLERRGAVRTLAEPTLTAVSGQEAEFLAGGEFPIPTEVDEDGNVTYTFKEFGVKLKFTPTVRTNGIIGLALDTSVSELTTEGGFNAGPITIPATSNRRAKTTVEMPVGQTLAIGGLFQDKVRQQVNQFPGLGNIPILGALFRSRDFVQSQTELLILVTPYLAQSSHEAPALPTDDYVVAGDAEAIFLGQMQRLYGPGSTASAVQFQGSVGFVLD